MEMEVKRAGDFEVTGKGIAPEWERAEWQPLTPVAGASPYASRAKVLYSETGMYFLFDCEDGRLTCTMTEDYDEIYREDVVEVFLWPDESQVLYFEYEVSPLGVELPLLIPNRGGVFMGWRPWRYVGERKIRKATSVRGGRKALKAPVEGWMAEFFIPFALMKGLGNVPPRPGMRWRANLYRIDYDLTPATHWAWSPATGANFHNTPGFGTFVFGR
jgi:hypothetical protein